MKNCEILLSSAQKEKMQNELKNGKNGKNREQCSTIAIKLTYITLAALVLHRMKKKYVQ